MTSKIKVVLALAVPMLFGYTPAQAEEDLCKTSVSKYYPVKMKICSSMGDNSGHIVVTNIGKQEANICWVVVGSDGVEHTACIYYLHAQETSAPQPAWECGWNNGGCYVNIVMYEVK